MLLISTNVVVSHLQKAGFVADIYLTNLVMTVVRRGILLLLEVWQVLASTRCPGAVTVLRPSCCEDGYMLFIMLQTF